MANDCFIIHQSLDKNKGQKSTRLERGMNWIQQSFLRAVMGSSGNLGVVHGRFREEWVKKCFCQSWTAPASETFKAYFIFKLSLLKVKTTPTPTPTHPFIYPSSIYSGKSLSKNVSRLLPLNILLKTISKKLPQKRKLHKWPPLGPPLGDSLFTWPQCKPGAYSLLDIGTHYA